MKEVSKEESFFKKQKKKKKRQLIEDRKEELLYAEDFPRLRKNKKKNHAKSKESWWQ